MIKSTRQTLLAKLEATYGVDPVPTVGANAIVASNVKLNILNAASADRNLLAPHYGGSGKVIGSRHATVDFDVELFATGGQHNTPIGAYPPNNAAIPPYYPLLEACGLAQPAQTGATPNFVTTMLPLSAAEKSITLYVNVDGKLRRLTGARGNCKVKLAAKGVPALSFSFTGLYNTPSDTAIAAVTTAAWKAPLPVTAGNTTCSLHGYAAPVSEFSLDLGNQVTYRDLINGEGVVYTNRKVTGSLTIEEPSVAAKNFEAIALAGTLGNFVLAHGQTAGGKVIISTGGTTGTASTAQIVSVAQAEQDGISMLQLGLEFVPVSGNDEIAFVFA